MANREEEVLKYEPFNEPPALSGSTFEDLLASLQTRLRPIRVTPPNPRAEFRWRSDSVVGSGVSIFRSRYSADWTLASATDDEGLNVSFVISGGADMVIGTKDTVIGTTTLRMPPAAVLYAPPTLRHWGMRAVDENYASVVLRFDAVAVAKMLTAMFDGPRLSKLELAPVLDLSTPVGQTLHLLARTIASGMHGTGVPERSPVGMALLVESALRLIFENVPHRFSDRLNWRQQDIAPKHIREAMDFMHANLHLPLTITDIADAAGVSERSLQQGFRKFRDTPPTAYLRKIRLEAAHAELSHPLNRLPVGEVALKWGFTHMGRFAAQYRAIFGVFPHETVNRTR